MELSLHFLHFWTDLYKVGAGNAHENLSSGDEFLENRNSGKPYLIYRLQLISILLSTFIFILGSNREYRSVNEMSVLKFGAGKALFSLWA